MVFKIASSPYTHNHRQTSRIMLLVMLAAVPGIAVQCWFWSGHAGADPAGGHRRLRRRGRHRAPAPPVGE